MHSSIRRPCVRRRREHERAGRHCAAPGEFGGDVSHLNLHKTFCIPHGGGGPGVGPVCVVEDLVPFLPALPQRSGSEATQQVGAVIVRRTLGNAAVLPISWMYVRMMGAEGLQQATESSHPQLRTMSPHASRDHYDIHFSGEHRRPEGRRRGARVHPRPAPAEGQEQWCQRRGRRQAADRLRLPRADAELPGRRHADGRADRERVAAPSSTASATR